MGLEDESNWIRRFHGTSTLTQASRYEVEGVRQSSNSVSEWIRPSNSNNLSGGRADDMRDSVQDRTPLVKPIMVPMGGSPTQKEPLVKSTSQKFSTKKSSHHILFGQVCCVTT